MIRELKNMREKELERLLGTTIEIVEKIDAPYFTIHFTEEEKPTAADFEATDDKHDFKKAYRRAENGKSKE